MKLTIENLKKELERISKRAQDGCGNHGCIINCPQGQGTNGICQCRRYLVNTLLNLAANVEEEGLKK